MDNWNIIYFKILNFEKLSEPMNIDDFFEKVFLAKNHQILRNLKYLGYRLKWYKKWRDATCIYYHISVFWSNWNLL